MTEGETMQAYRAVVEEQFNAIREGLPPEAREAFDEGRALFAEMREHREREEQRLADAVQARADRLGAGFEAVMRAVATGNHKTPDLPR